MANTDPLEWRLLDTDFSTVLGILPSDGGNLYVELNEPGSGELKIPVNSEIASVITAGMFAQCNYRGAARGGFLIDNITKVNANGQEGGGQWLSLSGRGALAILDEAIIWDDGTGNTKREFTGTKAGILIDLIDEAVTRGAIANVEYDFTDTTDSESASWTDNESLSLPVGTSLLELLRQFADTGIDFGMVVGSDGVFTLQAFATEKGSNLSSSVYFRVGTNCEEVSEEKRGTKVKNVLKMKWRDGFANVQDNTSIASYRRREEILNIEAAQSVSSATTYGAAKLEGLKDPQRSLPIKVYDGVTPYAFVSYNVGDYITIDRFGVQSSERIRGMQFAFNEAGYAVITITLNDTIYENEIDMGRNLDWLMKQWNTARDANLLEVSFWAAIGDPNITYNISDMLIVGSKMYVTTTDRSLLIYDIASGGWSRVVLGYTPNCLAHIGGVIYIGCFSRVVKYTISTGVIVEIGEVVYSDPLQEAVLRMAVIGAKLYCSGIFDSIDSVAMTGAAEYDTVGDAWTDIGGGISVLLSDGTDLYMGASVWAGGTTWNALGTAPSGIPLSMAMYGTHILMGTTAGDHLYEWDGATWAAFGGGVSSNVYSIGVYLTDVYIVGLFTDIGNYIAKYSGGAWWALEEGLNAYATKLQIYETGDNADVYVGGTFTTAGGKPALKLAAYFNNFEALADYLENTSGTFNLGEAIHNATAKTPLVAADEMPLWDSVSKQLRKITWANILVTIGTWADALYVKLTGAQTIAGVKTFTSDPIIPDEAYDATNWDGSLEPPTKNAVRDKIESMSGGGGTPGGSDTQVQFNDSGAFGGSADFIYDDTGKVLYLGETATSSGVPSQRFELDPAASASHLLFTWGTGLASFWKGVFARGTKASPTAAQDTDVLMRVRGAGYDENTTLAGSSTNGEIRVVAAENFDSTHHGANVEVYATPTTSTTLTKILTFLGSGHVDIASGKEYRVNGAQHTHTAADVGGVNKNVLPNGGMRVQQRGAGPFTSASLFPNNDAVYLIDGSVLLSDGNNIVDESIVADNDFVSGYKDRLDVETANKRFGKMFPVEQRDIQDIRYAGKASLQFKVKVTGTSIANCRAYLLAWDGTADTITLDPISAWGSAGANPTFATNWTAENTASNLAVSTTIATHEIENITVDTSGVNNLAVLIIIDDTDATVGDYFEIGDVKLEAGVVCTDYVNRAYEDDLRICRRQFEAVKLSSGQSIAPGLADSTANGLVFYNYKVAKRIAAHTFSYSALSDFTIRYAGSGVTVVTAFIYGSNGIEGATLVATGTGTPLTAGQSVNLRAANANAVLYFSAELKA